MVVFNPGPANDLGSAIVFENDLNFSCSFFFEIILLFGRIAL